MPPRSGWNKCPLRALYVQACDYLQSIRNHVEHPAANINGPGEQTGFTPYSLEEFHKNLFIRFATQRRKNVHDENGRQSDAIVLLTRPGSQQETINIYRLIAYEANQGPARRQQTTAAAAHGTNDQAYVHATMESRDPIISTLFSLKQYSIIRYVALRMLLHAICQDLRDGKPLPTMTFDDRFRDSVFLRSIDDQHSFGIFFDTPKQAKEFVKNLIRDLQFRKIIQFTDEALMSLPDLSPTYKEMWQKAAKHLPLPNIQRLITHATNHSGHAADPQHEVQIPIECGPPAQRDQLDGLLRANKIKEAFQMVKDTGVVSTALLTQMAQIKQEQLDLRREIYRAQTSLTEEQNRPTNEEGGAQNNPGNVAMPAVAQEQLEAAVGAARKALQAFYNRFK